MAAQQSDSIGRFCPLCVHRGSKRACRALQATAQPLKRIAAHCGYASEQNLRRAFQRQLGTTPAQYRSRFSAHAIEVVPAAG